MKKLLVLAIIAVAAWQAKEHLPQLLHPQPSHQAVVENKSGEAIERMRLTVAGRTFVAEKLANGESATFAFRVARDSNFQMTWSWSTRAFEASWNGGMVAHGPMVQRHVITIEPGGGVIYEAQDPSTKL